MAKKDHQEADPRRERVRVSKRIEVLRRKVGEARTSGSKSITVADAFDFEIMQRALEAFKDLINTGPLLGPQE